MQARSHMPGRGRLRVKPGSRQPQTQSIDRNFSASNTKQFACRPVGPERPGVWDPHSHTCMACIHHGRHCCGGGRLPGEAHQQWRHRPCAPMPCSFRVGARQPHCAPALARCTRSVDAAPSANTAAVRRPDPDPRALAAPPDRPAGRAGAVIGSSAATRDDGAPPCGAASARLEPAPSGEARCALAALAEEITDAMTCEKSEVASLAAYCAYDAISRSGHTNVAATEGRIFTAFHQT